MFGNETTAPRLFANILSHGATVPNIYLNVSHFLDHFLMLIFAKAAYDAGQSFGLNYEDIIIYGSLGLLLFGAAAPIAAWLTDWLSRAFLMIVGLLGMGVSCVLIAFTETALQLGIGLSLLGLFASIHHPIGVPMLIKRPGAIGIRLGVHGVWGNVGVAAAPLVTGVLLLFGDWRLAFALPGIVCILFGWAFLMALEDSPEKTSKDTPAQLETFAPHWLRPLIILLLSSLSGGFLFGVLIFILPRYFEVNLAGITTDVAFTGLLAALVYFSASFSQIVCGWVIDRVSVRLVLVCLGIGQTIFISLSAFHVDFMLLFLTFAAMCFVFGQIPITDTVVARYVPDHARPKIMSIKFMIHLSIGAVAIPLTSILLQNGYSFSDLMLCLVPFAVCVAIAGLFLPRQV